MIGAFAAAQGFGCVERGEVASTNDEAFALARAGADRQWVVARSQSGGRGRRGRCWVSPLGNLYASLALLDPSPPPVAAQIGFVAALALHDAVSALLAPGPREQLAVKWPNDLLLGGAKLSGILVEATTVGQGRSAVVIGIGVNLIAHATGAPYATTCLADHPLSIDGDVRAALFAALSDAMARRLAQWSASAGFAATRADWLARAAGVGETVRVETMGETISGRLRAMDERGRLVIEAADGRTRHVEAGEVFLAAAAGGAAGTKHG